MIYVFLLLAVIIAIAIGVIGMHLVIEYSIISPLMTAIGAVLIVLAFLIGLTVICFIVSGRAEDAAASLLLVEDNIF